MERDSESRAAMILPVLGEACLGLAPDLMHQAAVAIAQELAQPNRFREIHTSLNEKDVFYAVRDSDLDLVREVGTVAAAIAAGLPNAASVIIGLLVFLVRYRRKRIKLTADQAIVLKVLSDIRPASCTVEEIAERTHDLRRFSPDDVLAILTSLRSAVQADGTPAMIVSEAHGAWRAVDI
jgi:hypothetical protein